MSEPKSEIVVVADDNQVYAPPELVLAEAIRELTAHIQILTVETAALRNKLGELA